MATNILEIIQKNLGYPPLHKVDPNTQDEYRDGVTPNHTIGQAAIAAIVIGFYKYAHHTGNEDVLRRGKVSSSWADELFGQHKGEVVSKVANYANVSEAVADAEMEKVANEAIKVINSNSVDMEIKAYLTLQRANILSYLPEALHMGDSLSDNTLDDRTHKMQGPISNLVHAIEQTFSENSKTNDPIQETFAKKSNKPK